MELFQLRLFVVRQRCDAGAILEENIAGAVPPETKALSDERVGWDMGRGVPSQPTGGLGSVVSSFSVVRGHSPGQKRILAYFEGHGTLLLHLYADALSLSNRIFIYSTHQSTSTIRT